MRFIYTRAFAIFMGCLVAVAILVFLQIKGLTDPLKRALLAIPKPVATLVTGVTRPFVGGVKTIFTLRGIVQENVQLHTRIHNLEQRTVQYDQLIRENESLRKQLGFSQSAPRQLVPCTVLAHDPEGISNTIVISCNKDMGVKLDAAVVSEGYLIGKIIYVGNFTSTARLITHDDSSIDGKLSKTGSSGVVRGSFGSGLVMDLVSQNTGVERGELVVTAGINSLIPKNILVGEVGDVISKPNDLFKTVTVQSPISFPDLDYVFVVK